MYTHAARARRRFAATLVGASLIAASVPRGAVAGGLDAISNGDATSALRAALERGAGAAISQLGAKGGFTNDPRVKIPLPGSLRKTEKLMRLAGKGKDLDRLQESMNRAAEAAVPHARELVVDAVGKMSVGDAKKILSGPSDSVTGYFRDKTAGPLGKAFLPIVSAEVGKLGIAQQYNALAGQGAKLGLVKGEASSIEQYVTSRALDGLYATIAEKEKEIRANPVAAGSAIIGKVFGAIGR